MKREIIFEMPDTTEYRVVCQYNNYQWVPHVWSAYLQMRVPYKRWLFFGETKWKWSVIGECWFSNAPKTIDELKKSAIKLYDEKVTIFHRLDKQAMDLK